MTKTRNSTRKASRSASPPQLHLNAANMPCSGQRQHPTNAESLGRGRAVWCGRLLFIFCLSATAVALGWTAHCFLTRSETDLTETQFESIADRALAEAYQTALRKKHGAQTIAAFISEMYPNATAWPFVCINNFELLARSILSTISAVDMAFSPLVPSALLSEWENFAYDFYYNKRRPPFPNDTAVNSFGRGVWKYDPPPTNKTRDNGTTSWASPNDFLVPMFQLDDGADPVLLLNLHSEPNRGRTIDQVVECTSHLVASNKSLDSAQCGVMTDILERLAKYPTKGPGSAIYQPIYPANDPTVVVGFVSEPLIWEEIFMNIFADEVSGIDCIIQTGTSVFMYTINDGRPVPKGASDRHQEQYEELGRCTNLTDSELYSLNSTMYELCLYPNSDFYGVYSTTNPLIATVGAVCIILLTSLFFFLYDFFVRREFSAKDDLLEAKRKFMRFVSHEVRTPLNSVCLGLGVIQGEIAASLGFRSVEELELCIDQGSLREADRKSLEWFNLAHEVRTNAQTAVDVLTDLLNYDKIENGKLALELSVLPIWTLIERTANEFKLPARNKEINLVVEFVDPEKDPDHARTTVQQAASLSASMMALKVIGDNVRLTQVLRNLLSNALKFTPQGGSIAVRGRWCRNEDKQQVVRRQSVHSNGKEASYSSCSQLELTVTDTGAGMTSEQIAKLYQDGLQFNVNELQAGQGSGIGLYIAKGIVMQHGGSILASSRGLGCGTTFTVTLPLYYIPTPSEGPTAETTRKALFKLEPGEIQHRKLKILVVDDVASNRKLLCRLLKNNGHDFAEAENGQVAVAMTREAFEEGKQYDAILLDYEMPVMNGPDAAKEIRSFDGNVLIVGVTGNMLPEDVSYYKSCGANAVLPKPLKLVDLERTWNDAGIQTTSFNAP